MSTFVYTLGIFVLGALCGLIAGLVIGKLVFDTGDIDQPDYINKPAPRRPPLGPGPGPSDPYS